MLMGENRLFMREILLGGSLNSKWGKMGDHLIIGKYSDWINNSLPANQLDLLITIGNIFNVLKISILKY